MVSDPILPGVEMVSDPILLPFCPDPILPERLTCTEVRE